MIDPVAVRDAALATSGVIEMHPGPYGTSATFCAEGRIWGVRTGDAQIDVHIVGESGRELTDLGKAVQSAVRRTLSGYTGEIVVHIEDVTVPVPTAQPDEIAAEVDIVERIEQPRRIP